MHKYLTPLEQLFEQHRDHESANKAKAYLLHHFEHYGIKTPIRRELSKQYFQQHKLNSLTELTLITKDCFAHPYREFHHAGIELYTLHKNLWTIKSIEMIEFGLLHKSWWDSVDTIASDWIHPYFKLYPEQIVSVTQKWNLSSNLWLQRSSILFQKFRKKETDTELLAKYIINCSHSDEFFIQKAIGWALREFGKTNPYWVKKFVRSHELPPLSKREALKHIA